MARGQRGRGQQRPIKGFRPGKEPAQLRKQRAKQELGGDPNWAQERLIEALADRSPAEARKMMGRWRMVLLAAAIVVAVLGGLLYAWSIVAGVIVHVLALALFLFWFQLRRKQKDFEAMAELVSGRSGGRGGRGGR
jgi:Flp pilus assembly protein TadB